MRIEELDMTLRPWPSGKRIGHARTADGRSISVGVEGSKATDMCEGTWKVTLLQGPVSVEGDWHPTIQESYEQAVLEALEGAPKLARTIADIARQVRQRRHAAEVQREVAHDAHLHVMDYERDAQEDAQDDGGGL